MVKREKSFLNNNVLWIDRFILIGIVIVLIFQGIDFARQKTPPIIEVAGENLNNFANLAEREPIPEDLAIPEDEDQGILNQTLKTIFPEGTAGLSEEEQAIEVSRYVVVALENKNNFGTASKILKDGYAICSGNAFVFRILMRKLNIPARNIDLFYTPGQGGHNMAEVYYDGSWHLFGTTFGLIPYSNPTYDKKGEILSMAEVKKAQKEYYLQTIAGDIWAGDYSQKTKLFGLQPLRDGRELQIKLSPDEALKSAYDNYGNFSEYMKNEIARAFPVAYGATHWISLPVDIDLISQDRQVLGQKDQSSNDLAQYSKRFMGINYLGKTRDLPMVYNTFTVKVDKPQIIIVKYYVVGKIYNSKVIPLRSVNLQNMSRQKDGVRIELKIIDELGIFIVLVPLGSMQIDAIEVSKE